MRRLIGLLLILIIFPCVCFGGVENKYFCAKITKTDSLYIKDNFFNPFSKILEFFSSLFHKKREFNVKIPIPPPPPPPPFVLKPQNLSNKTQQLKEYKGFKNNI